MTAEAAVMNRIGVGLAADSAVTIGGRGKVYTSADKLFQLSPSAPVGVMIYGNANFLGLPWETIVKEYRAKLGKKRYKTTRGYAGGLVRFLCADDRMFPASTQQRRVHQLVATLFLSVRRQVEERLDVKAEELNGLDDPDVPPILEGVIEERLTLIRQREQLKGLGAAPVRDVGARYGTLIRGVRKAVFGDLPLTLKSRRQLTSIATGMLTRQYFGPLKTGVVVAGFGDTEHLPSLIVYEVEGSVLGRPRAVLLSENRISDQNEGIIQALAQQGPVRTFLEGIDPDLSKNMVESTGSLFTGTVEAIVSAVAEKDQALGDSLSKALSPQIQQLVEGLFKQWEGWQQELWKPVVNIAASLPKEQLASMAEALVNITKVRRQVTPQQETVAGPIDVAVITKGDGFVWVKRKHYFEADLNPRVIARYEREG